MTKVTTIVKQWISVKKHAPDLRNHSTSINVQNPSTYNKQMLYGDNVIIRKTGDPIVCMKNKRKVRRNVKYGKAMHPVVCSSRPDQPPTCALLRWFPFTSHHIRPTAVHWKMGEYNLNYPDVQIEERHCWEEGIVFITELVTGKASQCSMQT